MAENNFRKGPHAAKNKIDVDMSSISPSADERKTVVLDEDLEGVEFEDKVWLYWTRNKNFIVFSVILVLAVIIGVQGFKMYKASRAASLASAYEAVSSDSQLLEFAKSNAGTPLAGAVQIQVADAAYSSGDYAKAASLYDSCARELSGTVLADLRKILGLKGVPVFRKLYSWKHAIAQYNLGYGKILDTADLAEKEIPNFAIIGSFRGGVGVGNCIENGLTAGKRILDKLSKE